MSLNKRPKYKPLVLHIHLIVPLIPKFLLKLMFLPLGIFRAAETKILTIDLFKTRANHRLCLNSLPLGIKNWDRSRNSIVHHTKVKWKLQRRNKRKIKSYQQSWYVRHVKKCLYYSNIHHRKHIHTICKLNSKKKSITTLLKREYLRIA